MCRPSGTPDLLQPSGGFRPRLQIVTSLTTPLSANTALIGARLAPGNETLHCDPASPLYASLEFP